MAEVKMNGHPLLRGGRRSSGDIEYEHGLSSSQMKSLSAICEALIPSIAMNQDEPVHLMMNSNNGKDKKQLMSYKAMQDFYLASASHPPFPDEVNGLQSLHY